MSATTPPAQPPSEPEFTPRQNEVVADLANAMTWAAIPLVVVGLVNLIGFAHAVMAAVADRRQWGVALYILLASLFFLAIGVWTSRAARSFDSIARTSGHDMSLLMSALDNLRKLYSLLRLLVIIYVVMLIFAIVLGFVTFFSVRPALA